MQYWTCLSSADLKSLEHALLANYSILLFEAWQFLKSRRIDFVVEDWRLS